MTVWPNDSGFDTCYEEHEPVALAVQGTIPTYAAGVLYRTGPLGYKVETDEKKTWAANHWFDGFSAVHRFEIDFPEGSTTPEVSYRSRRIVDEYLDIARKKGKLDGITFASKRDPCETFFKKVMSMFQAKRDSKNVGVTLSINMPGGGYVKDEGKPTVNGHTNSKTSNGIETLHTKTDANIMRKIDPVTLESQRMWNQAKLHPELKGPFTASHAKSDPITNDLFNFNLDFGYKSTYRVFRTSAATGKTDILATFTGKPAYLHSLFLSENYVILCIWNSHITWGGISVLFEKNVVDAIAPFNPSDKAKWYVIDRKHGKGLVATYDSDPFFAFHSINAWEEPSSTDPKKTDIICELTHYDNTDVIHRFFYDNIISSNSASAAYAGQKRLSCLPHVAQFRLGSVNAAPSPTTPLPAELVFKADKMLSLELAVINPAYVTHRHRFVYGVGDRLKSSFMDCLGKFDNTTQKTIFWEHEGHTPGEPIFIADPDGKAEDDGVLLSVVLDGYAERSYMLVLDARTMEEVGRAEMKGPMAFGFHGTFKAVEKQYRGDY